ncbi:MAG TPA: LysE family translocator [Verrucomicrobiae bacterium]|jgi:threonine/homoserine/homoserine lactone efflux protein|nr:LysE family translocator [Verrucomicrobiae bacterium]
MFPNHTSLLIFVSAAALLLAIPGPAVFYIVGRSIGQGRNAGLVSALGIGVGTLIHTLAAAVGLSALLVSSATAFSVVKYLGAAYLVYLGIQRLRSKQPLAAASDTTAPQATLARVFSQGIVVNVLNPKTALFFFAFLPQFIDPARGHVATQILSLGVLFACMGTTSDSLWALFSGSVAGWLRNNQRWMRNERYVSGGILISLGVATAFVGHSAKK